MVSHTLNEVMSLSMDEIYEGRRKYPRVESNSIMSIELADGKFCEAKIVNVSLDGAQINCDKETAKIILPQDTSVTDKQAPKFKGAFELEVDGEIKKIEAECKIYYVVSLDGVSVSLGLLFEELETSASATLDLYVMRALEEFH